MRPIGKLKIAMMAIDYETNRETENSDDGDSRNDNDAGFLRHSA